MDDPKGGLIGRTRTLARRIGDMNIPGHAAGAAYFIILAVFPMLVLLLSILRYTQLDAQDLMALLEGFIPRALTDAVEKLIIQTYAYSGAAMVSVSAVGALWSASRGIYGILRGLNAVCGVEETRGWIYVRAISVFYTFAFIVALLMSLAVNVFGEYWVKYLPQNWGFLNLRFLVLLFLQTVLFCAMFTVLPDRQSDFRRSLPGALLASLGWMIFSHLFSWYVEHWGGYSNIYGSVYAIALGMLWLYCCLSILFYGAALNRLMEEKGK